MFEELRLCSWAVARHLSAPFAEERARYIRYCAERGDSLLTLTNKGNKLIYVARQLTMSKCWRCGAAGTEHCRSRQRSSRSRLDGEARSALGARAVHDLCATVAPLSGLVA